jgi:transposase
MQHRSKSTARARRAKSDALDVTKLLNMLIRYHNGERDLWSVIRVPTPEDEDRRQPARADRTQARTHPPHQSHQGAARCSRA